MVLKMMVTKDDDKRWRYYDNIASIDTYYNEDIEQTCVTIRFRDDLEVVSFPIEGETYLCNDEGKTIDHLYYAAKDE